MRKGLLFVGGSVALLVLASSLVCSDQSPSKKEGYVTQYVPRSEGDNLAYSMLYPWVGYCQCPEVFRGTVRLGYEFRENRHGKDIAKALLVNDELVFVGKDATPAPTARNLLADYFMLASDTTATQGAISFNPKIKQHILTFDAFFDLPEFWPGFYVQIEAPLVHADWNLHDSQGISQGDPKDANLSQTPFAPGYMAATFYGDPLTEQTLYSPLPKNNWFDALTGTPLPLLPQFATGEQWGTETWNYGKFFGGKETDTKLASLNFNLGYNFYACQDRHIGAYIRLVAPSGTKFDEYHAEYLFHPKIGEAHWKLGAGLTAHAELGSWCDCDHTLTAYFQGYLLHPFAKDEVRVFDLKNKGPLSRYMLLKEFSLNTTNKNTEATGRLVTAINYTTRHTRVKLDFQGELAFELAYQNACGFTAGIGYNFYGRSKERMKLSTTADLTIEARKLGLKGTSYISMAGFGTLNTAPNTPPELFDLTTIPPEAAFEHTVTSTESAATIYGPGAIDSPLPIHLLPDNPQSIYGTVFLTNWVGGFPVTGQPVVVPSNGNVIAQESATGDIVAAPPYPVPAGAPEILWGTADNMGTPLTGITNRPVLLTRNDIDLDSAASPRQISHKIYGHLDYAWTDCWCAPYVRAGGEIEMAPRRERQTMNAWSVFVNCGVNF